MSNVYKNRELLTIARNADNSITCCLVWYRTSPIEYVVFSPPQPGKSGLMGFVGFATQHEAMQHFEELTA